mmetsp:Transcript_15329/g.57975  ORF Transcript_15329/g.57975 Transcript_15329/m.57975 type:complete len:265 (+) Transcript_15329:113-907(+)
MTSGVGPLAPAATVGWALAESVSWSPKVAPMKRCTTSPRGLMMPLVVSMAKHMNAASTRSRMSCSMKRMSAWAMEPKRRPAMRPSMGELNKSPLRIVEKRRAIAMPTIGEMMQAIMTNARGHWLASDCESTLTQAMTPKTTENTKPLSHSTRLARREVMYPSMNASRMMVIVRFALSQKPRPVRPVITTRKRVSVRMQRSTIRRRQRRIAPASPPPRTRAARRSASTAARTRPDRVWVPSCRVKAHVVARQTMLLGLEGSSGAK